MPEKVDDSKYELISKTSVGDYLSAHSKYNDGWKGFFRSNLFVALTLWVLSQAVLVGGLVVSAYWKTGQLAEWKGGMDATIKEMNEHGTTDSRYRNNEQDRQIAALEARMNKQEELTQHIPVIETEHRRLTQDVDELKHGKK